MPPTPPRRRGAPLGNSNNFKHGFYSRRLKKRDHSGVEATDTANLAEEIALIRVYTRRMLETFDPHSGFYEHADLLRIPCRATAVGASICLASASIARIIRAHALLNDPASSIAFEIEEAIRQVNAELRHKQPTLTGDEPTSPLSSNSSTTPDEPRPPTPRIECF